MTPVSQAAAAPAGRRQSRPKPRADGGLSAEFVLVAACCRWPPSAARDAAIRDAAAGVIDWERFLGIAKRQRVVGLAHDGLTSAGIDPPSAVARELAARAKQIARQNLILGAETVRLYRLLDAAGIPVMVLKGAAVAQLAYGSAAAAKHARDIDLLVAPDRAEAALRLIEGEGYALSLPAQRLSGTQRRALIRYGREAEFAHGEGRLRVELQWRAVDNPLLLKGVGARSPAQRVALADGAAVRTLAPDDLFAYLCAHGAHHGWSRMKWLADVNAVLAADGAGIVRLYRHAQELGAGICAGQALALCRLLFDLKLPPAVADEIDVDGRIDRLVGIALAAMTAPRAPTEIDPGFFGVARDVGMQFLLGRGWPFLAAQCRAAAVGPADVIRWPLPPALHFLYPVLRLPLWLWRRGRRAMGIETKLPQR